MSHHMFHRPPVRISRVQPPSRWDDRIVEWEMRHPLLATWITVAIVAAIMFVAGWTLLEAA